MVLARSNSRSRACNKLSAREYSAMELRLLGGNLVRELEAVLKDFELRLIAIASVSRAAVDILR